MCGRRVSCLNEAGGSDGGSRLEFLGCEGSESIVGVVLKRSFVRLLEYARPTGLWHVREIDLPGGCRRRGRRQITFEGAAHHERHFAFDLGH